jgi:hypothetical protein
VHNARENPFENIAKWREIQEALIKRIIYIENQIRFQKQEIKNINLFRKNPQNRLSKDESLAAKTKIEQKKYQIEEYRWLLDIFHSIGDAIAFTFLHKLDIKPMTFKETAGFISEKSGLKKEMQMFKYSFKNGIIAILNDLTSALRYADITLITKEGAKYVEVKSSENRNSRTDRQKENAEKVFKYLETDITEDLYGIGQKMQRRELGSPEINYLTTINELIEISKSEGFVYRLVEPGVLYFISHSDPSLDNDITSVFKDNGIEKPIAFMLNAMKFPEQGYYPFALSISNPHNYLSFLEGDFTIIIFVDLRYVDKIAKRFKFIREESDDPQFVFSFTNNKKDTDLTQFKMSGHFFQRIPLEFVSLKWLFEDTFKRFSHMKSKS